jgi:two-component system osmolarity sensor histidine kinase EnvZ
MPFSPPESFIKRLLPQTLFGRAMLIIVLPTLLVQLVSTYMFYERHWDNVRKHMSIALANDIDYIVREMTESPDMRWEAMHRANRFFDLSSRFEPDGLLTAEGALAFPSLATQLYARMDAPFLLQEEDSDGIWLQVQLPDGVLHIRTSKKRIASATTYIFILWMNGAAILFLLIAILFLRKQVRPIERLAEAAEAFGRGKDLDFRPRGALEIRRAGHAFLIMKDRIQRQMSKRAEMLAAISHDLRTPITRMKLQLAMLKDEEAAGELKGDLQDMEGMIDEYLDYVRGAGGEGSQTVAIDTWLADFVHSYRHHEHSIAYLPPETCQIDIREQAFKRCMSNLMNNALRYGTKVELRAKLRHGTLHIFVDDNGPGIPENERQNVFTAFRKIDKARKPGDGGVGLGLSIAKDIVLGHGGTIELERSKMGGLRVHIQLPV